MPQFCLILSLFVELNFDGDHKVFVMALFFSPLFCLSVFLVLERKRQSGDSHEITVLFHKPKGSN